MSTKQVTCRYFIHGVCREGSQCLFSHDLANSKPSTICKYYQKGFCAYGTRCRYDHTRPSAAAGGAVGPVSHAGPSPGPHSPHAADLATSTVRMHTHEPGKREKRTLVLRDRNGPGREAALVPGRHPQRPGGRGGRQLVRRRAAAVPVRGRRRVPLRGRLRLPARGRVRHLQAARPAPLRPRAEEGAREDVHADVRARDGEGVRLPGEPGQGVQHLHGGDPGEGLGLRAQVRDPVQLQPHLLPVLHPPVAVRQAVREPHHQIVPRVPRHIGVRHPQRVLGGRSEQEERADRSVQAGNGEEGLQILRAREGELSLREQVPVPPCLPRRAPGGAREAPEAAQLGGHRAVLQFRAAVGFHPEPGGAAGARRGRRRGGARGPLHAPLRRGVAGNLVRGPAVHRGARGALVEPVASCRRLPVLGARAAGKSRV